MGIIYAALALSQGVNGVYVQLGGKRRWKQEKQTTIRSSRSKFQNLPLPSSRIMLVLTVLSNRVFLHATDESALSNGVTMDILKKFAADGEAQGGGASLEKKTPITPGVTGGIAKETH